MNKVSDPRICRAPARPSVALAAGAVLLGWGIAADVQAQEFDRYEGPGAVAVNTRLAALAQECRSEMDLALTYDPQEIIASVDFNADGRIDPVLDQSKVGCDGSPVLWSGTGGAPVRIFASNAAGGWDEHTSGGFAGRVVIMGHVPVWVQLVHGTTCDGAGALPCVEALIWGEGKFRSVADGKPVPEGDDPQ
jgi:hypothetical protein